MRKLASACIASILLISAASAARALPIKKFLRFPEYKSATISPRGTYLAVVTAQPHKPQRYELVVLKTASVLSGKVAATARFKLGQRKIFGPVFWINDHRLAIATAHYHGGFNRPYLDGSLFAMNTDGSGEKVLMGIGSGGHVGSRTGGTDQLVFFDGLLSHVWKKTNSILVKGIPTNSNEVNAYLIDTVNDRFFEVASNPYQGGMLADHDGKVRLEWGSNQLTGKPVMKYRPLHSMKWKNISSLVYTQKNKWGAVNEISPTPPIMFGPHDKTFYFPDIANNRHLTYGLYRIEPATGEKKILYSSPSVDIGYAGPASKTPYIKSFDRKSLVGLRIMPGKTDTLVLNSHSAKIRLLAALTQDFPKRQIEFTSWTRDGDMAILKAWSDDQPAAYYLYSSRPKPSLTMLFLSTPWIKAGDLSSQRPISYKSRDGLTIHGYLTLPEHGPKKDLPLVIYVHGGPYGVRYAWGFDALDFDSVATQILANHGYAVLAPNYRGSGGYGARFENAGFLHWGNTMQDDLADAAAWAIKKGIANPHRICIVGASYGGYAALMSAELFPKVYRCAVGYSGVYDLPLIKSRASVISRYAGGRFYENTVLGSNRKTLKAFSPIYNTSNLKAPVLLIHGGRDEIAPAKGYDEMIKAIKKRGTPLETVYERNEGHGFYKLSHREKAWHDILAFLNNYIGTAHGKAPSTHESTGSPSP